MTTDMIVYHSQPATQQDRWVIEDSHGLRDGFFVEIGAFDGVQHSNTLTLERYFGWKGLLVEADPCLFEQVVKNRPGCGSWSGAVAPQSSNRYHEKWRFTRNGMWGGLSVYLPPAWQDEAARLCVTSIYVPVKTLQEILEETTPPQIDYLSLDIEGAEVPVLEEYFRFPNRIINRISVEYREDAEVLARLRWIMEPHGYTLVRTQCWDAFFKLTT